MDYMELVEMERIGIYGGTFNPPHLGHIQAAKAAVQALDLTRLLLIPDNIAPHKELPPGSPAPEQRLEMLRLATQDAPELEVSDLELRREGVSYTFETVLALSEQYPEAQLFLLMGTDMFVSFDTWKNTDIILSHAALGVLCRGDKGEQEAIAEKAAQLSAGGARVELVNNPVLAISSTQLRRLIAFDCAEPFLPKPVAEYIRQHGLYDSGANW